ncbi:MAG TPA: carbamate kinase [Mycobacteriales bacterium]|nr:carbamate kinase [Mycobacteriales bacterium]
MRVVVALGGNALLQRGESPDASTQEDNVRRAVASIAELARRHDVVVTHGNGPQVGLLALESEHDRSLTAPYPLDVLGAETEGMVGYWLQRELTNELPGRDIVTVLTQTVVDPSDPAFADPAKFIGQVYDEAYALRIADQLGWTVKPDGAHWRRVVPSPAPIEFIELGSIKTLVDSGALVICAGGGGVPVVRTPHGLQGVEAVVDKDRAAALLGRQLGADILLLLTDVAAVQAHFGTPDARPLGRVTTRELRAMSFPAGSMAPKITAACDFVEAGGRFAAIGALDRALELSTGTTGTVVERG